MQQWTDERLDDFAAAMQPLPVEVAKLGEGVDRLTDETRSGFQRLTEETRSMRTDLSASQRQIARIGWALAGTLFAAVVALTLVLV